MDGVVGDAVPVAGQESELTSVARAISTCTLCDLSRTRTKAVPGEGNDHAEIMFIGEGPGMNEDRQGRPFVGRAGLFLNQLIALIGLERGQVYITNVVKCRPPDNRDPHPTELSACRPYLFKQMQLIDPKIVVTLGRYSLGTFFPNSPISRVHGVVQHHGGRDFFPMYHPAAALHQERYRQVIIDDMRKLGRWLDEMRAAQTLLIDEPDEQETVEQTQLVLF